jgi:5-methylcytosine-specific restriction protein A
VVEAVDALTEAAGPAATADEALSVLTVCEGVVRQLDRLVVSVVADLVRRGVFTERGYRDAVTALADLLGWDRAEARRRVSAAEQVCPRTGLDGSPLPARLPATAEKFAGGAASLRHVDVISRVLASPAARRLAAEVWAGAEVELAGHAEQYAPAELLEWGSRLVDTLDQDGPEPNDRPPDPPPWIDPLRRPRRRPPPAAYGLAG